MANRRFTQLSPRWRMTLVVLTLIVLPAELLVHGILAKEYYYLNIKNLQLVALASVKMGAQYLPTDPRAAVWVADAYAQSQGIAPAEIVFTRPSSNNSELTIRFDCKIPRYLAVLAMGGLPARDISVTASAWRQGARDSLRTQILDVPGRSAHRECLLLQGIPRARKVLLFGIAAVPRVRRLSNRPARSLREYQ